MTAPAGEFRSDRGIVALLRDGAWLNAARARGYGVIMAVLLGVASLVSADSVLSSTGHPHNLPTGVDFVAFRAAASMAIRGDAVRVYQAAPMEAEERAQAWIGAPGYFPVMYPPSFLLLIVPLALMPFAAGFILFEASGAAILVTLLARVLPGEQLIWRVVPVLAFPGVLNNVESGQNGLLTASCFAAGAVWLDRRPLFGGACLGLLLCKPHLAVGVPVVLVAGRRWQALAGFLASSTAIALASVAVFGVDSWVAFFAAAGQARHTLELSPDNPARMASLFAAVRLLRAGIGTAYLIQAALACLVLAALWRIGRISRHGAVAAMAVGGLMMSPYLFDYDLACLVVPLAYLLRCGSKGGFLTWEKLVMAAAFILPLVLRPVALTIGISLAPVVLAALLVVLLRRSTTMNVLVSDLAPESILFH